MRRGPWVVVAGAIAASALASGACIRDELVACGELLCPRDEVCTIGGCATREAAEACEGLVDGDACQTPTFAQGTCAQGACRPAGCGNGLVDQGERCDDGNTAAGDGCSADCRSDERCGNDIVDGVVGEQCDRGIPGLSGDGCSSTCTGELPIWRNRTPELPAGRRQVALAADPWGGAVMFGGTIDATLQLDDETWTWDGTTWIRHAPQTAPSPRRRVAMAADPVRGRVVLFGGDTGPGASDETWEWNGAEWSRRDVAVRPPASAASAMAFDPVSNSVLLLNTSVSPIETWSWDGETWTKVLTGSAPEGFFHGMVHDSFRNRILAFTYSFPMGETVWEWSGTTWTRLVAPGCDGDTFAQVAFDASRGTTVVRFPERDETWELNGQSLAWFDRTAGDGMLLDRHSGMAYVGRVGRLVAFGGVFRNDTWQYYAGSWTIALPLQQIPNTTTMTYDEARGVVLATSFSSGTLEWNGLSWIRRGAPGPSYELIAYDPSRRETIALDRDGATSRWDGTWNVIGPGGPPVDGSNAEMVADPAHGTVVVFGGQIGNMRLGKTWLWDGTAWTEAQPARSPSPRFGHAMAYDPVRQRIVLYGGIVNGTGTNDVWEWDGTTWTPNDVPAPGPFQQPRLAYDAARSHIVLVHDGGTDTWAFDGVAWTQLPDAPRRTETTLVRAQRGVLLLTARPLDGSYFPETWVLGSESGPGQTETCIEAATDSDGDGASGCNDPDCWIRCRPFCPPGAACDPTQPRCGDGACSFVEDENICPSDCS